MPSIGIIRGVGEGYNATGYIIKLIKALNRRFRSKIKIEIINAGDYIRHGPTLSSDEMSKIRCCDAVFSGDIEMKENLIEYSICDIALALDNTIEYDCIEGIGDKGTVDVLIASYFDGGAKLRYNNSNEDGCSETRICSTHTAMQVVKNVSRECENRRRRLAFVTDSDNEYSAKLFLKKFNDFTMPLPNFQLIKFPIEDITYEIMFDGTQFDVIFASKAFADYARGMYNAILKEKFASYVRYAKAKGLYYVKSGCMNIASCGEAESICSYIMALCDLLRREFDMIKESEHLIRALEIVLNSTVSVLETEEFVDKIIAELDAKVTTKHSKTVKKKIYIK